MAKSFLSNKSIPRPPTFFVFIARVKGKGRVVPQSPIIRGVWGGFNEQVAI